MFRYTSVQTHSEFKNGKGKTKTQRVNINGNKGYKMVMVLNKTSKNNRKITRKKYKKSLSKKEIESIKKCQFIPGLFSDCEKRI